MNIPIEVFVPLGQVIPPEVIVAVYVALAVLIATFVAGCYWVVAFIWSRW